MWFGRLFQSRYTLQSRPTNIVIVLNRQTYIPLTVIGTNSDGLTKIWPTEDPHLSLVYFPSAMSWGKFNERVIILMTNDDDDRRY